MHSYTTIAGEVTCEIEVQRSRFLTRLVRVESEDAARRVISEQRAAHPKARHHCTAFVLGPDGRLARHSDDGEPSGTAGQPMYETLTAAGLSDVVAVVTRYFGGVLLGAAGLTRAYRAATLEAVKQARLVQRHRLQRCRVRCTYEVHGPLLAAAARQGMLPGEAEFGTAVTQDIWVLPERGSALQELLATLSAGAAQCEFLELVYRDVGSAKG